MASMSAFAVNILQKTYDSGEGSRLAIAGLSFEVREGELVCVLGPSGDRGRTEVARRLTESAPTVAGRFAHERYQQRGDPL